MMCDFVTKGYEAVDEKKRARLKKVSRVVALILAAAIILGVIFQYT